jgi:hypothetical protein
MISKSTTTQLIDSYIQIAKEGVIHSRVTFFPRETLPIQAGAAFSNFYHLVSGPKRKEGEGEGKRERERERERERMKEGKRAHARIEYSSSIQLLQNG